MEGKRIVCRDFLWGKSDEKPVARKYTLSKQADFLLAT